MIKSPASQEAGDYRNIKFSDTYHDFTEVRKLKKGRLSFLTMNTQDPVLR
jgi:hypothetical protein